MEYFINKLDSKHRFALIKFNHEVHSVTDGLVQMTDTNKALVLKELQQISAGGSTNLSDALFESLQILKDRQPKENVPLASIMLFSDGMANCGLIGPKLNNSLTNLQISPDITINTFGFGAEHDSATMRNLAM